MSSKCKECMHYDNCCLAKRPRMFPNGCMAFIHNRDTSKCGRCRFMLPKALDSEGETIFKCANYGIVLNFPLWQVNGDKEECSFKKRR